MREIKHSFSLYAIYEECALTQEKLSEWNGKEGLRNAIRLVEGPEQHYGYLFNVQENEVTVEM
jgi:hypothetical protein